MTTKYTYLLNYGTAYKIPRLVTNKNALILFVLTVGTKNGFMVFTESTVNRLLFAINFGSRSQRINLKNTSLLT